jgi:uncharacterized membrane protein HdeD (DUF308 family)
MKNKTLDGIKTIKNTYVGVSLVSVVLGLILVLKPELSATIISYIIGGCFVFYGALHIFTYVLVKNDSFYQYDLAKGIIAECIGAFLILKPTFIVSILPTILGLAILVNGIFGLQSAMNMLRNSKSRWLTVFIPSIVTIVLGILIVTNPFHWAKNLLIVLGAFLIWNGVSNFWTHLCLCKKVKETQIKEEAIDTTASEE